MYLFRKITDLDNLIGTFDCGYSTDWKFSNFAVTFILREISFCLFQKALTVLKTLNFDFWKNFTLEYVKRSQMSNFRNAFENGQNVSFWSS